MKYTELNAFLDADETPIGSELLEFLVAAGFNHLKATDFETLVLRVFESFNFFGSLTPVTGDEGVDVLLQNLGETIIAQCKRYDDDSKIGSKELREFLGAITHAKAIHGYYVTTSSFSDQARSFAKDHDNITLIDGEQLKRLFLFAIVFSFDKLSKVHRFVPQRDTDDLDSDFRAQAEDLYNEYRTELEKLKNTFRKRKSSR